MATRNRASNIMRNPDRRKQADLMTKRGKTAPGFCVTLRLGESVADTGNGRPHGSAYRWVSSLPHGWGPDSGLPPVGFYNRSSHAGSVLMGACPAVCHPRSPYCEIGSCPSARFARVAGPGGRHMCGRAGSGVSAKESLDRSACGRDGSGAGILGNILGPGKVRTLARVGRHTNVTGADTFIPLLL